MGVRVAPGVPARLPHRCGERLGVQAADVTDRRVLRRSRPGEKQKRDQRNDLAQRGRLHSMLSSTETATAVRSDELRTHGADPGLMSARYNCRVRDGAKPDSLVP